MKLYQTDLKKIMILGGMFLFTAIQLTFGQSKVEELDKLLQLYHEY